MSWMCVAQQGNIYWTRLNRLRRGAPCFLDCSLLVAHCRQVAVLYERRRKDGRGRCCKCQPPGTPARHHSFKVPLGQGYGNRSLRLHTYIYMYVCMYIYIPTYIHTHCILISIYIYIIFMYIYIYIYYHNYSYIRIYIYV